MWMQLFAAQCQHCRVCVPEREVKLSILIAKCRKDEIDCDPEELRQITVRKNEISGQEGSGPGAD